MNMKRLYIISLAILFAVCFVARAEDVVVDSLAFRSSSPSAPQDLLRGQVAGVRVSSRDSNPFGAVDVSIRGISSVHTDNQPLWIVDGVIVSPALNDNHNAFWQYGKQSYTSELNHLYFLNPAEIESIEVVKDASRTSVYGTLGANGVIIVKTRMPQPGRRRIQLNSNVGMNFGTGLSGLSHNHLLSVGESRKNNSYNLSASFRDVNGILPGNSSRGGSVKANFTTSANNNFKFGLNALISADKTDGCPAVVYPGYPSMTLSLRDPDRSYYPYDSWISGFDDKSTDLRALGSAYAQLFLAKSMYLKVSGGIDAQYNRRDIFYGKETQFGAVSEDNVNGGRASNVFTRKFGYNAELELNFNKYINTHHHLTAFADAQVYGYRNNFNTMNGCNFSLDILRGKSLDVGVYSNYIREYPIKYNHIGAAAGVRYEYKDIAGVDASCRIDDTFRYLNNGFNRYPAANVWFNVHNLMQPSKTVKALILNAGYGESGVEKYLPFGYVSDILPGEFYLPESGTNSFYDALIGLHAREYHFGVESVLFGGRLEAGFTWFSKATDESFRILKMGAKPEDSENWQYGGCSPVDDHNSKITNRGVELSLKATPVRTKEWKWSVSATAAFIENRIKSIDDRDVFCAEIGEGVISNINYANLSVGNLCGYMTGPSGEKIDITGEGDITRADMVNLGSTVPTCFGGLESVLSYKGWTLDILVEGAAGHKVANMNFREEVTSDCVEDADYLRLRQVGLSYKVPLRPSVVKALSFRLLCNNVVTLTKYTGWNPEVNCFGYLQRGIDTGSYPLFRTISLGVNVEF